MEHVHARGYVHRDLKPCNVLVRSVGSGCERQLLAKVADFGMAARMDDAACSGGWCVRTSAQLASRAVCATCHLRLRALPAARPVPRAAMLMRWLRARGSGTPYYWPPEVFPVQHQPPPQQGPAADVWAFGILMSQLVWCPEDWPSTWHPATRAALEGSALQRGQHAPCEDAWWRIMAACLHPRAEQRPSFPVLVHELEQLLGHANAAQLGWC